MRWYSLYIGRDPLPDNFAIDGNRLTIVSYFVDKDAKVQSAPAAHFHRYFVVRDPTWRFDRAFSSTQLDDFWTHFVKPIRYRRRVRDPQSIDVIV